MKIHIPFSIFCLLIVASTSILAQNQVLKFSQFTGTNGISLGKINAMTMDKNGFMWLSDQSNRSIVRFDGSQMVRFKNDPKNPNSLGGYYPECIFADSSGIIWIGFYGQGLDRYDPATETFTHYRHSDHDSTSLNHDFVSAILVDHLGNVWVGNDGGLDLLDQKTGTFRHFRNVPGDSTSLSHNVVRSLYEDRSGTLWIGTGFVWGADDKGGLNRYNRDTETFTSFIHDPKNPNTFINNKVRSILEDSRGTFWIGTVGDGLHTMDRNTGVVTRHRYNPAKPEELSRTPLIDEYDHITFLKEDTEGQIWIGTLSNGIVRYDPSTGDKTIYGTAGDDSEFKDNTSWSAIANPDGLIWISTQESKLYKADLYNDFFPQFGTSTTNAFCESSDDVFWIGTTDGLIREEKSSNSTKKISYEPKDPNSLSHSIITALDIDQSGNLWIGTQNGLNRYNTNTQEFTRYLIPDKDESPYRIHSLIVDKQSNVWAGTGANGLFRIDALTKKITHYQNDPADPNSLTANYIYALLEDQTGDIWIGTDGLDRLNPSNGMMRKYLSGLIVASLYKDSEDVIWAGIPEGGLYQYDRITDDFYSIGEINNGIEIPNVAAITEDLQNNLWIASSLGLYKLNSTREHVTWYSKENGIPVVPNFRVRGAYTKKNGELYFGFLDGYYAFYPSESVLYGSQNSLFFTDLFVNNEKIIPSDNGLLKQSLLSTQELNLSYSQNVFAVAFSSVDFRYNEDNQIYYRLKNYDDVWRPVGSEKVVRFYQVPYGQYNIEIKTADSNGKWIEKNLAISISPPLWATWWAYIGYGLLMSFLGWRIHLYQKERTIRIERERSREKELAQAKEIEKAYTDLKSTQAQLIQSEKMASLGELTAGIAHEIQNPLNFVNNFSEVNTELIDELTEEAEKGNLDEIKIIAKDIKENSEKISHHGKRADAIVKGMLQHSRTSTGQKELTDINALCDEYLRLSYHGLRAKDKSFNADFQTNFDADLPKVNVIPQDIGRVLLNLINNAFYAVHERSKKDGESYKPAVSISTKKLGNSIQVSVKDNGNGIPDSIKEKIFQPFFTTKPTGQGTGLGLSLSYDIVKAHGGELKVESPPAGVAGPPAGEASVEGKGTMFIISLPIGS